MLIILILALAVGSGVLGRMGGAQGFNTKFRDVGCSLIAVFALIILFGFKAHFWWVYIIIFGLHWGAFSTYWDFLFKFDNLWFSGFIVGLCIAPIILADHSLWGFVIVRAILIAVSWGLLNKYLPSKVLLWRRDVAEEFSRYAVSL